MFRPNQTCTIRVSSGKTDMYGQPALGRTFTERCAVVKLSTAEQKTSVRTDSSASRGAAFELVAESLILLTKDTAANIDDILVISGITLKIMAKQPRFSVTGALDHYEVIGHAWS